MGTSTAFTMNVETGSALIFMSLVFMIFLLFALYIFWPIKEKDKLIK